MYLVLWHLDFPGNNYAALAVFVVASLTDFLDLHAGAKALLVIPVHNAGLEVHHQLHTPGRRLRVHLIFHGGGQGALLRGELRRSTRAEIEALFAKLRSAMPDVVIRTSLICGLPGEGEAEFEELCGFLREQKLQRAGGFR